MAVREIEVEDIRCIFRTVAPLIIRQWKEVCRELGVPEDILYEVERGKPWERLSEMAYQGMCAWYDREGKQATKSKLIKALRRCELKRAEEAVECMTVRRVEKHSARRWRNKSPIKSRKSSISRLDMEEKSIDSKSLSQITSGRKHSDTTEAQRDKWDVNDDEIAMEVTASEVMTSQPFEGSWVDTYQKMVLHFYTSVVKSEDDHKRALMMLMDFRDVFVKRIVIGSLVVVLECRTLKALEQLQQTYMSGQLEIMCQHALVRKPILDQIGATDIFLEVYINPKNFDRCKEIILSRKLSRSSLKSRASSRTSSSDDSKASSGIIEWPEMLESMSMDLSDITERYSHFEQSTADFLKAMQVAQVDSGKVTSLGDVIDYHSLLKNDDACTSSSVELVREYLDIANSVRAIVQEVNKKMKKTQLSEKVRLAVSGPLSDLELMLHPEFPFREDLRYVHVKLSVSEKRSFLGLLAYIPLLISSLRQVITVANAGILPTANR